MAASHVIALTDNLKAFPVKSADCQKQPTHLKRSLGATSRDHDLPLISRVNLLKTRGGGGGEGEREREREREFLLEGGGEGGERRGEEGERERQRQRES